MTTADSSGRAPLKSVRIERRGGLAGLHVAVERDCAALTATQRQALDKLVAVIDMPTAAIGTRLAPTGADRFSYRIYLSHADGQQRVIDVPEDGLPSALAGLLEPGLA